MAYQFSINNSYYGMFFVDSILLIFFLKTHLLEIVYGLKVITYLNLKFLLLKIGIKLTNLFDNLFSSLMHFLMTGVSINLNKKRKQLKLKQTLS